MKKTMKKTNHDIFKSVDLVELLDMYANHKNDEVQLICNLVIEEIETRIKEGK